MPDASTSDPAVEPQATPVTNVSGGVNVDANQVTIGGDVVGRDKITTIGYSVEQVSTLLTQISSTFQPKPFDGRCPYLGLDYFSEDDADRFFGRETLVSELVARVTESRFVVIAGPSGSGKSSLARAGLIHALKQGALPNSDRWLYATFTPGRDPIESLALAMSRMAKSPDAGKYLREHSTEPSALHDFAESQLSDRQDQRAVIFVDQFEEVFTQVSKDDERLAFLNLLTHAATQEYGRVTVLFALRSDFVSNCATYPQLNALLNQQFMQVGAMQPDELVSAIARPALQVGLRIDPDLIVQIVNDMQHEPGALPLMQFALKDLFDAQQAKGGVIALTLDDYLARGGLRKALERHADAAFGKLSEREQQLARTIFSSLIEIGRGTQDTRRTAAFDELVPASINAAQVKVVVEKLADARLITTDERGDKDTVTISHERLIEAWPWLYRLVNENREAIALQNQIAEDAQKWEKNQRDASYLYSGARLATAREELTEQKIVLSGLGQKFVEAGVEAFETARRRRRHIVQVVIGGLVILLLIFAGLSAWAINSQQLASQSAVDAFSAKSTAEASAVNESAAKGTAQSNAQEAQRQADIARAASTKSASEANSRATAEADALAQRDEAQHQSQISFYRQLAAQTTAQMSGHFDLALLLSIETARLGDKLGDSNESRDRILNMLETSPHLAGFFFDNSGAVWSVSFSPDGKILASSSGDNSIILWDMATHQRLGEPLTSPGQVGSLAFSPDGKTLVSGGCGHIYNPECNEGAIILWDVATHQRLGEPLTSLGQVNSVAFSPDGKTLASGNADKRIILWDVATHQILGGPLIGHSDEVKSVAFSPDGKTLASGSIDNTIILWDVATHQRLDKPLTGHTAWVSSVAFNPDGRILVSGSGDHSIILWDVASRQPIGQPLTGHSDAVDSVAFSPDGKTLASGSIDNTIILWDVATRQRLDEPYTGHSARVSSVTFSPDGKTLASGSWDNSIILWDVATRQRLNESLTSNLGRVCCVAFSPDGRILASGNCGHMDDPECAKSIIDLWDMATHQRIGEPLASHRGLIDSVAFSPDGKTLASAVGDGSIILWDVATHQPLGEPLTSPSQVYSLAFSPDGKTLASGSCGKIVNFCVGGAIILWDVATRQRLGDPFIGHSDAVWSVAFSPDGKTLASSSGGDNSIILWDVATRQPLGEPLTGQVISIAFSPDGKILASGDMDGSIILWDVATRQPLGEPLLGHSDQVRSVAFSPDGKTLASGSWDNSVILWDVATRQRLGKPFVGHSGGVNSMAFSPNGMTLASGSDDANIILWNVDPESWVARACQIVGRNLTRSEWARYFGDRGESYRKTCEQWPLEPEATSTPIPTP